VLSHDPIIRVAITFCTNYAQVFIDLRCHCREVMQDATICLLHTFQIFVDKGFPPNCAHTFQPPQKAWNRQTKHVVVPQIKDIIGVESINDVEEYN